MRKGNNKGANAPLRPLRATRAQTPNFSTVEKFRVTQKNTVPIVPNNSPIAKVLTPSVQQSTPTKRTAKMANNVKLMSPPDLNQIRSANLNAQTVAGFRYQLNGIGTTAFTLSLPASGKQLLGIAINAVNIGALADTSLSLKVNNRDVISEAGANTFNPNYTLGLMYYPTPNELTGKDTIKVVFNKQDAGNVVVYLNVVYVPQL